MTEEENALRKALGDGYEVIKKLGAGGMATVYLAREKALDRQVAIKLLPKAFSRDAGFVSRFKNEAQVAANLEHPHIVRIYQISEQADLVYFVMSFVPGGSVTDRIKEQEMIPLDDLIQWAIDACSALAYGHERGVIHRDLKPDNIMIDKNNRVVLMDYGIAKAGEGTGLTQAGSVIGTPQYMSPEQARGLPLDARSDIYSMGIVLYQMATGELPFQATDAASLMYMHVHETPEPPDARNADIPEWLKNIILKCLAKNPVDRFASADELKAALSEKYSPKITVTPMAERDRKKRRIALVMTAAAVVVIAIAAVLFFRWQAGQREIEEQARIQQQQQEREQARQDAEASAAEKDDMAYENALSVNTKEAFNSYLMLYPAGRHLDEVKDRIAAIETRETEQEAAKLEETREDPAEAERRRQEAAERRRREQEAEQRRMDDTAYQQAEMVNSIQSYNTYLKNYPNGIHREAAMVKLASLDEAEAERLSAQAEEVSRRDDLAFQLASSANTKEGYNTYLISFPDGEHSAEARAKITSIEEAETQQEKIRVALSALSLRMVEIVPGGFLMGSEKGGGDEKPVNTVRLAGLHMSSTEITQAQYESVIKDNPSYFKLDDNSPVERVTWRDAITFCNRLSEKVGLESCYNLGTGACDYSKSGFRLPTEAEWEYACRAGSGLEYSLGDGESALNRAGWYQRNSREGTHPVAQKTQNEWGLYDMHGNVWEWCNDWYDKGYYGSMEQENPRGSASGKEKVIRGGGWLDNPRDCRSAKRKSFDPAKNYSDIGFRVVRQ